MAQNESADGCEACAAGDEQGCHGPHLDWRGVLQLHDAFGRIYIPQPHGVIVRPSDQHLWRVGVESTAANEIGVAIESPDLRFGRDVPTDGPLVVRRSEHVRAIRSESRYVHSTLVSAEGSHHRTRAQVKDLHRANIVTGRKHLAIATVGTAVHNVLEACQRAIDCCGSRGEDVHL